MKRAEEPFINQHVEYMGQLYDCDISHEARQIIHTMRHEINRYEFNQMIKRRKEDDRIPSDS